MNKFNVGDRLAVDPVFHFAGVTPVARYGTVTRVKGYNDIDVCYDGSTSISNIDPRIARHLHEGE